MRNPWLGLKSYEEGDHLYGRGKEADELANIVMNSFHTIIYGKSGIGKTSLLRAGVFPTLRYEDFLPIYIRLEHDENADEDSYLRQIENALNQNQCSLAVETGLAPSSGKSAPSSGKSAPSSGKSAAVQTEHAPSLQSIFSKYRFSKSRGIELTPVIVFDQFEEIFTLNENRNSTAVDKFFSDLSDILNNDTDSHNYRIVFCLREDYLYYIERLSESIPAFKRNRYCLQDLTHDEAMEVITLDNCNSAGVETRPATSPGTYVDVNTAEEILRKISPDNAEEYNATILSLYMSQLFDKMVKAGATTISSALVQQFGDDIISTFYFDSIAGISEKSIEYLEDHLVTTGGYRHNIPLEDAITAGVKQPEIDHLKDRRIINIQPRQGNILYMEYAHDVLCPIIVENRGQRALRKKAKRQRRIITVWVVSVVVLLGIIGTMVGLIWQISKRQEAMMLMQSRAIAGQAEQLIDQGKYAEGVALCLRALPEDWDNPDRPVSYKPIAQLMSCMYSDFASCQKILRHDREALSISFSQDGRYLVTAAARNDITIWDVSTGKVAKELKGHTKSVQYAQYSPNGKYIVSTSSDGTIRLWNAETGKQTKVIKLSSTHDVSNGDDLYCTSVFFSPDSKFIVSSSVTDTSTIWNVETGEVVKCFTKEGYNVRDASFSADGKYVLASANKNGDWKVVIWEIATGREVKTFDEHDGWVEFATYSHDGRSVVTGTYSGTVNIWNVATGKVVKSINDTAGGYFYSAAFSPNGKYFAIGRTNGLVDVYDAKTLEKVRTFAGLSEQVYNVTFSNDSRYLAAASMEGTVMIWNMKKQNSRFVIDRLGMCEPSVACDSTGRNFVMCPMNRDSGIVVCETATGRFVKSIKTDYDMSAAAYSPDGKIIMTYTNWMNLEWENSDSIMRFYDVATGKMIKSINNIGTVSNAAFSSDGRYVVTTCIEDGTIRIWDIAEGRMVRSFEKTMIVLLSCSKKDNYVAMPSMNAGLIEIININDGSLVREIKDESADGFMSVSFSNDGKYLASITTDYKIKIWNVSTGELVKVLGNNVVGISASFSPDGEFVVVADFQHNQVVVLSVKTGERVLCADVQRVTQSAFTPDGRYIVCMSNMGTVEILRFYKPQELIDHFRKVVGDYKFTEDEEIKYYLK